MSQKEALKEIIEVLCKQPDFVSKKNIDISEKGKEKYLEDFLKMPKIELDFWIVQHMYSFMTLGISEETIEAALGE